MTNEELTAEVVELKSALFAVSDLAQKLGAEIQAINERQVFVLNSIQGTTYAQEAIVHALMAPVLRNNELSQKQFQIFFDGLVEQRRAQMAPDAIGNFDTAVNSARGILKMLVS